MVRSQVAGRHPRSHPRRAVPAALVAGVALLVAAPAALAAPSNDGFADASAISALPFSDTVDTAGSTIESGEPQYCVYAENSVWYAITPQTDGILSTDTNGTFSSSQVNVYRAAGAGFGGLSFVGCQNFGFGHVVFAVQAGETYYLQASTLYASGSVLRVSVEELQPPANDDFADAASFSSVPFSDQPDLTAASVEAGEPTTCVGSGQRTVWYEFTPSVTSSYAVSRSGGFAPLAVHTGDSLSSLRQLVCGSWSPVIFRAQAGQTYWLQLGSGWSSGGVESLSVDVAPPATASFYHYPGDPSILDTVQFIDNSWDPAGIVARAWAFGDGAAADGCCPSHRYAADGDYEASLAIATTDERAATATRTVRVRTHDVAISRLSVPQTARVGQTRQLSVSVLNTRYAEHVEVALLRSVPGGGFERVGNVTQSVPARGGGRATTFAISYTFGPDDARFGKVTFQAIATLVGARDAVPADNAIVALPTKVTS